MIFYQKGKPDSRFFCNLLGYLFWNTITCVGDLSLIPKSLSHSDIFLALENSFDIFGWGAGQYFTKLIYTKQVKHSIFVREQCHLCYSTNWIFFKHHSQLNWVWQLTMSLVLFNQFAIFRTSQSIELSMANNNVTCVI